MNPAVLTRSRPSRLRFGGHDRRVREPRDVRAFGLLKDQGEHRVCRRRPVMQSQRLTTLHRRHQARADDEPGGG